MISAAILKKKAISGIRITIIGDSITYGFGSSDNAHRWTTLYCVANGYTEINMGVSGRGMTRGISPWHTVYLTDTPTKTDDDRYLIFALGINDLSQPLNTFISYFTDSINEAIARGWDKRKIAIVNVYYNTVNDQALSDTYNAGILSFANSQGIKHIDVWTAMVNGGGSTLLTNDNIHPNDTGYQVIANKVILELI